MFDSAVRTEQLCLYIVNTGESGSCFHQKQKKRRV